MKRAHIILALGLLALLLAPGLLDAPAAAQGTNLLTNPGFEPPYPGDNNGGASGWVRWHRESSADQFGDCTNGYHKQPRWGQATDFVYEGSSSQYIGNNWDTWSAGMWQTVSVTPGATYRFSFWARGRGAMEGAPAPSNTGLNMKLRAGIDPNGSGLWSDGDVVWSAAGNAHDQWVQFSVEATATGDKITVFTSANWAEAGVNQCYKFLDTYYDAASLVELGPPPTNTPPPPPPATNTPLATATPAATATPTLTPTATPTETPSPVPGGRICVNAFDDQNANGVQDESEGFIAGVTFTVASSEAMVGQAISAGGAEPTCFDNVPAGAYQVAQLVPGRLEMTTAGSATITINPGDDVGLNFGSRLRPADVANTGTASTDTVASNDALPTADPDAVATAVPAAPADEGGMSLATVGGLVLVAAAVVLLGVLLFVLLRRQTG
ncbi:MAG: hypothetical protein KC425_01095 [Anaerolineales bacterium]|nr:hypothetical protein [Anaerolineales bacterium]